MQHLEVSAAVRRFFNSLGFKGLMKLEFSRQKSAQVKNFTTNRSVGAEVFHADRQTDRYDVANGRFSQFCLKSFITAFLKLWSADHKWSSGSALVVLLD